MNFYKHHIGDYAKKTGALSLVEHGAYLLMLHAYYGTEEPLPTEPQELYRLAHAHTRAERDAVDSVKRRFWRETPAGLVNGRAFEEMELASEAADASRTNGKLGGRPRKTGQVTGQVPEDKPNHNLLQTPDSTSQTPDSQNSQSKTPHTLRVPASVRAAEEAGSVCGTFKKIGRDPHAND